MQQGVAALAVLVALALCSGVVQASVQDKGFRVRLPSDNGDPVPLLQGPQPEPPTALACLSQQLRHLLQAQQLHGQLFQGRVAAAASLSSSSQAEREPTHTGDGATTWCGHILTSTPTHLLCQQLHHHLQGHLRLQSAALCRCCCHALHGCIPLGQAGSSTRVPSAQERPHGAARLVCGLAALLQPHAQLRGGGGQLPLLQQRQAGQLDRKSVG
jgi:hypothetical protein